MRLPLGALLAVVLALVLPACGGSGGSSANSSTTIQAGSSPASFTCPKARLTAEDVPDALIRAIWPGARLRAYCQGDSITVYTAWSPGDTTVDQRTVEDAAQTICGQIF